MLTTSESKTSITSTLFIGAKLWKGASLFINPEIAGGEGWKRNSDVLAIAGLISGLSKPHADYLTAGGKGFMLGDGNLNYHTENIVEAYYAAQVVKQHLYLTGGYQFILNPGYNADRRGPVHVFSIRSHIRF